MKKQNLRKVGFVTFILLSFILRIENVNGQSCPFTQVRAMDGGDKLYERVKNINNETELKLEISRYFNSIPESDKSFDWQYYAIGDALYNMKTGNLFDEKVNSNVRNIDRDNYIVGKSIFYIYFKNKNSPSKDIIESNPEIISCKLDNEYKAFLLSLVLYNDSKIRNATYAGSTNSFEIPSFLKNRKSEAKLMALYSVGATGIITVLWYIIFCESEDGNDFCESIKKLLGLTEKEAEEMIINVFTNE